MSTSITKAEQNLCEPSVFTFKNENNKKLLHSLYKQKSMGQFCDVQFVLQTEIVQLHACVVVSFSSYLTEIIEKCSMYKNNSFSSHPCKKELLTVDLTLEDLVICNDCFKKIIDFMYLGHILVDSVHINHLEMLSEKLRIRELILFCSRCRNEINKFHSVINKCDTNIQIESVKKNCENISVVDENNDEKVTDSNFSTDKSITESSLKLDKNSVTNYELNDSKYKKLGKNDIYNNKVNSDNIEIDEMANTLNTVKSICEEKRDNSNSLDSKKTCLTSNMETSIIRETEQNCRRKINGKGKSFSNDVVYCKPNAYIKDLGDNPEKLETKTIIKRKSEDLINDKLFGKKIKILLKNKPQLQNNKRNQSKPSNSQISTNLNRCLDISLCKNTFIINRNNVNNCLQDSNLHENEITKNNVELSSIETNKSIVNLNIKGENIQHGIGSICKENENCITFNRTNNILNALKNPNKIFNISNESKRFEETTEIGRKIFQDNQVLGGTCLQNTTIEDNTYQIRETSPAKKLDVQQQSAIIQKNVRGDKPILQKQEEGSSILENGATIFNLTKETNNDCMKQQTKNILPVETRSYMPKVDVKNKISEGAKTDNYIDPSRIKPKENEKLKICSKQLKGNMPEEPFEKKHLKEKNAYEALELLKWNTPKKNNKHKISEVMQVCNKKFKSVAEEHIQNRVSEENKIDFDTEQIKISKMLNNNEMKNKIPKEVEIGISFEQFKPNKNEKHMQNIVSKEDLKNKETEPTKIDSCSRQVKSMTSEEHMGNSISEETKTDICFKQLKENVHEKHIKSGISEKNIKNAESKIETKSNKYHYRCLFCSFHTFKLKNFVTHLITTEHEYTKCLICNYKLEDKSLLKTHLQFHMGPKPFFCHICDKNFYNRRKLKEHLTTHTSKLFACQFCDETFHRKVNLKSHILSVHLNVALNKKKPLLECTFPGCKFNTVDRFRLTVHIRTHTERFYCHICNKCFSHKKNMLRHVELEHISNTRFVCSFCKYTTKRKYNAEKHYTKKHKINRVQSEIKILPAVDNDVQNVLQVITNPNFQEVNQTVSSVGSDVNSEIYLISSNCSSTEEVSECFNDTHCCTMNCIIPANKSKCSLEDISQINNINSTLNTQNEIEKHRTSKLDVKYDKRVDNNNDPLILSPIRNESIEMNEGANLINTFVIQDTELNSKEDDTEEKVLENSATRNDKMNVLNKSATELLNINLFKNTQKDKEPGRKHLETNDIVQFRDCTISVQNDTEFEGKNERKNKEKNSNAEEVGCSISIYRDVGGENENLQNMKCAENNTELMTQKNDNNASQINKACLFGEVVEDVVSKEDKNTDRFNNESVVNESKLNAVINYHEFNSGLNNKELSPDEYILNEHTGIIIFPAPFLNEGTGELSMINLAIEPQQFINLGTDESSEIFNADTQSLASDDNTLDEQTFEHNSISNNIFNVQFEFPQSIPKDDSNIDQNLLNESTGELLNDLKNKSSYCSNSIVGVSKSDPVINGDEFNSDLNNKELIPDEYILNEHTGIIVFPAQFLNEGTGELSIINLAIEPQQFINMGNDESKEIINADTLSLASDDNNLDDFNIEHGSMSNNILDVSFKTSGTVVEDESSIGGNFLNELTGELLKDVQSVNLKATSGCINEAVIRENKSDLVINWHEFNSDLNNKELIPDEYILNEHTGNIVFPAQFLNEGTGELSMINLAVEPQQFINMGNDEDNGIVNGDTLSLASDNNTLDDINFEPDSMSNNIFDVPFEPPGHFVEDDSNMGGNFLNELTGELSKKYLNNSLCTQSIGNELIDKSSISKYSVLNEATGELVESVSTDFDEDMLQETNMILNESTGEISANFDNCDPNSSPTNGYSWNDWFFDTSQDDSLDSLSMEKNKPPDYIPLDTLMQDDNFSRDCWNPFDNGTADILLNESTGELIQK